MMDGGNGWPGGCPFGVAGDEVAGQAGKLEEALKCLTDHEKQIVEPRCASTLARVSARRYAPHRQRRSAPCS